MSLFRPQREQRDVYGGGTFNPFDNPAVPLSSVAFDNVYGLLSRQNNASGKTVTADRALALPTVWRCVGLLATVVAGCPLMVYREADRTPIRVPCLDKYNFTTTYTPYELNELVVAHLALWGNAFVRKIRGPGPDGPTSGTIIDLVPITPSLVDVKLDDQGNKIFLVRRLKPDGSFMKTEILTTFEVMHIPGLGYDGIRGLSPLQVAAQTYGTAMAADELAAKFYSSGTQLSGILKVKVPLTEQAQADEIKRKWQMTHAGTNHSGEIAVLDAETDFQSLTIPPDSLQFLESREWQASELARIYGIPPHLIGDESKSTSWGTGIEQQNIGFVAYTVAGWTGRMEQRYTREVVSTRGQYAVYDLTQLMRGSTSERFQAYAIAVQWGWLTRNEARAWEDLEPIDGLDVPLTPLNMQAGNMMTEGQNPNVVPLGPAIQPGSGTQQLQGENSQ